MWLTGLMGSGKSTVGGALARRTGWPHVDNDLELAAVTGRPLAGWPPGEDLHRAEDALLSRLLTRPGPFIADVPASAANVPARLTELHDHGIVVYLRAPVDVLVERTRGTPRPLGTDPQRMLSAQWHARDAAYTAAADVVLDATLPPDLIVDQLSQLLSTGPGRRDDDSASR